LRNNSGCSDQVKPRLEANTELKHSISQTGLDLAFAAFAKGVKKGRFWNIAATDLMYPSSSLQTPMYAS